MPKLAKALLATLSATLLLTATPAPVQATTTAAATETERTFTPTEIDAWIAGASAILNYHNHEITNLFAHNLRPDVRRQAGNTARHILTGNMWNIQNRDDLIAQVESLTHWGHNSQFWYDFLIVFELVEEGGIELLETLVAHGGLELSAALHMLEIVDIAMFWGEAGIVAWDMFRVGNLLVWGYHADFITRAEARELMVPAIHILREHFDSWEEAAANYLDGLLYWRRGMDDEVLTRIDVVERMFEREDPVFNNSLFD